VTGANNYFAVRAPTRREVFAFCDLSERETRIAFLRATTMLRRVELGEGSIDVNRPVRWRLEHPTLDLGVVGVLRSIRHLPDVTFREAMSLRCSECGIAETVRAESAEKRDEQSRHFEQKHSQCGVVLRLVESPDAPDDERLVVSEHVQVRGVREVARVLGLPKQAVSSWVAGSARAGTDALVRQRMHLLTSQKREA
jgi:hypothetical protein